MVMADQKQVLVSMVFVLVLVVYSSASSHHHAVNEVEEEEADRISSLPGQPKVSFQQFSGYVTVNEAAGRALFYWLTEAVQDPLSKPLVVWLNGGPGCSSVAYGASEEIGPFRIKKTASGLYLNKFSWNSVANLLFLETPAGVGFSYSNRSSDLLDTGDIRTAKDSLEFLVGWMNRFPRYKHREVYLTGESYAGHYVPQLAREIMMYNKRSKHPINLKGFMVGNAVTDNYYDNLGTVTYWWSHAMISDKTYRQLINTCDFRRQKESDECESLYSYAMDQEFGNIDQYNIYAPPCNNSDGSTSTRRSIRLPHHPHKVVRPLSGYDPCTEKYAEIYYNRPDVQRAFHANVTKIPYKWTACSEVLNRNWNDTDVSVLPIYREMLASGLRIWVFSGDVDSVVPVTATRYSLAQLKLATKTPWRPWYVKKQIEYSKSCIMSSCVKPLIRQSNKTTPVVLLHCFDSSCLEWRCTLPLLEEDGLEAWAIDVLGWGFSDLESRPPCDVASKRHHLYELWKSYIRRPIILVGPSLGASVAIDFTVHYPEAVEKLVLINPSVYAEGTGHLAKLPELVAYVGVSILKSLPLRLYANMLAFNNIPFLTILDWTNVGRLHCFLPWWKDSTVSFMFSGGYNVISQIKQVKHKTLIICGEKDQIVSYKLVVKLHSELSNAIIREVSDSGHLPHVDNPKCVAKLIANFAEDDVDVDAKRSFCLALAQEMALRR